MWNHKICTLIAIYSFACSFYRKPFIVRLRNLFSMQVTDALARAGLESSNLILGIDFTKSNEWTGKITITVVQFFNALQSGTLLTMLLENRFKVLSKKKFASSWRWYESLSTGNIHYWENFSGF